MGVQVGGEGGFPSSYCEEVAREVIGLDDVAAGFAGSPNTVLDASLGSWEGWFDVDFTDCGVLTDAALTLTTAATSAELVSEVEVSWTGGDEDGAGAYEVREASAACPTRWELPVTAALAADEGGLDEVFALTLSATALDQNLPEGAIFSGSLPAAELVGTVQPPWEPAEVTFGAVLAEPAEDFLVFSGFLDWVSTSPDSYEQADLGGFALSVHTPP